MDTENAEVDEENPNVDSPKRNYMRPVAHVFTFEVFERAACYTVKASLPVHLYLYLGYSRQWSRYPHHLFEAFADFCAFIGAIITDSYLEKYNTLVFLSLIYFSGLSCLIIGAAPILDMSREFFTFVGLVVCSLASGFIRPSVVALGGDQFDLPEQKQELTAYFFAYLFMMHFGKILGQFVAIILRDEIVCFGQECYMMPFIVGIIFLTIAVIGITVGRKTLKVIPFQFHAFGKMIKVITVRIKHPECDEASLAKSAFFQYAISLSRRERKSNPKDSWLDRAEPRYGREQVRIARSFLHLLLLLVPSLFFFAILDQIEARWIYQAANMVTRVGNVDLKAEYFLIMHPILGLVWIPVCYFFLNPLIALLGLTNRVQKIAIGGIFLTLAVFITAVVELNLEKTAMPILRPGFNHFRIYNGFPECSFEIKTNLSTPKNIKMAPMSYFGKWNVDIRSNRHVSLDFTSKDKDCPKLKKKVVTLTSKRSDGLFLTKDGDKLLKVHQFPAIYMKPYNRSPSLRIFTTNLDGKFITLFKADDPAIVYKSAIKYEQLYTPSEGKFNVLVENKYVWSHNFLVGDIFALLVANSTNGTLLKNAYRLAPPNRMSILWLLPQHILLTLGDVMIIVNALHFMYEIAPVPMKTIFVGCWYLAQSHSNILFLIVVRMRIFKKTSHEFFFFGLSMLVGTIMFTIVGYYVIKRQRIEKAND